MFSAKRKDLSHASKALSTSFYLLILLSSLVFYASCSKEGFTDSPDARLRYSIDTLRFDTVFITAGSITQQVKIFNDNNQKIKVASIRLGGGNGSYFALNADGTAAPVVQDLDIGAHDSIYVFVAVTIPSGPGKLPFLVQDSIVISCNGNTDYLQLEAYGQNAEYIRNGVLNQDTRFTKELPYVILGGLRVASGVTLTIDPGARIFFHADAPLVVDGSLQVNGTKTDSVVFRGDRLDEGYRDLPAAWPGIYFRETSVQNRLEYAQILNAYQAIVVDQPSTISGPKLTINESIISNSYETGILGIRSSIQAVNCLVNNCGVNILLTNGGSYDFTHCTVASYTNLYLAHKKPVLVVSNWDSTQTGINSYPLSANFTNNIFWGDNGIVDNEVLVSKKGNTLFQIAFRNNLYKALIDPEYSVLTNNIRNQDPLFDSIQVSSRFYDFRINTKPSPAVNAGINAGVSIDLEGKPRDLLPDIGSYEKK